MNYRTIWTIWKFSKYATDGIGAPLTKLFGKCLRALSTLLFLGLLILLAKGSENTVVSYRTRTIISNHCRLDHNQGPAVYAQHHESDHLYDDLHSRICCFIHSADAGTVLIKPLNHWTSWFVHLQFFDPAEVLYMYSSGPGYLIIAMRLIAWCWFCYAVYFTLVKYPEKRNFYQKFSAFYSLWFEPEKATYEPDLNHIQVLGGTSHHRTGQLRPG